MPNSHVELWVAWILLKSDVFPNGSTCFQRQDWREPTTILSLTQMGNSLK